VDTHAKTTPSAETRATERDEARHEHAADRPPTDDEERAATSTEADPETAAHYEEMADKGARAEGEGRIP